jgi:hypothetical protein
VMAVYPRRKSAGAKAPVSKRAGRNGDTKWKSKPSQAVNYLREKIEFRVAHYEVRLQKIDSKYAAEVVKLAKRTKDPALAHLFQQIAHPPRIAEDLQRIRKAVVADRLVEADCFLEHMRSQFDFLEWHLRRRYMTAGLQVVSGGEKAAEVRYRGFNTADRDRQVREIWEWERERGQGLSKLEADKKVAVKFRRSVRTVREARRKNKIGN